MRIGHVVPTEIPVSHAHGGALQRRVRELASAQVAAGHDVFIFSPREVPAAAAVAVGPAIVPIPISLPRPFADYEYLMKVADRARQLTIDVMHAHGAPEAARFLHRAAAVHVQTVDFFRYRGANSRTGRAYFRSSLNMHQAVLPVSHYCARGLLAHYKGLSTSVRVVPNGVNLEYFRDMPAHRNRAQLQLSLPSIPFVLYVGRVTDQKGSDMLPGLARRLLSIGSCLVVSGPTEQFGNAGQSSLVGEIQAAGARYLGPVPEETLPGLMASATLLVLPTRRNEMFGMVLIEAGAAGTPAVASDHGGIPEVLGDAGVLFPSGDQGAFEEAVLNTISSPALLEDLRARAVANAARFSWPKIEAQYLAVYEELLGA